MSIFKDGLIRQGASGGTSLPYQIEQSIRFDRASNTSGNYMQRDFSSAGNRKKWTWSCWFKLGDCNSMTAASNLYYQFLACDNATSDAGRGSFHIIGDSGVASGLFFQFQAHSTTFLRTNRQFRDPTAWYQLILIWDSDNGIASDRTRLYINGQRETDFATQNNPSSGQEIGINLGEIHRLGISWNISGSAVNYPFDGYMSEIHFADGYAYGPEYFGESSDEGIWRPIEVDITYGSKGFYLAGQDSSALGDDTSGNGNDFTTTNFAVHDQVTDTPTNNFCTINSAYADDAAAGNGGTLTDGNLDYTGGGSTFSVKGLTFNLPKSGKWYFEYTIGGNLDGFGFVIEGQQTTINASNGPGQLSASQGGGIQYRGWRNGGNYTVTFSTYSSSSFSAGELHQVAIDVDNGKWYYGIANSYYANDGGTDGNPSSGTNHTTTFDFAGNDVVLLAGNYSGTQHWNFGQNGTFNGTKTAQGNSDANGIGNFFYAVPTGYLALCSKNLGA